MTKAHFWALMQTYIYVYLGACLDCQMFYSNSITSSMAVTWIGITSSRKHSEIDWVRARPRLGSALLCKLREWESSIHFCLNEVSDPLKGDTFTTQGIYTLLLQGSSSIWRGQIWLHVGTPNISLQFIPGDSFSDTALIIKVDAVLFNLW